MSNWFSEARINWIGETVSIFGFINRDHIKRKFGVSTPQASYDLKEAMRRWPKMMTYDSVAKRYVSVKLSIERS